MIIKEIKDGDSLGTYLAEREAAEKALSEKQVAIEKKVDQDAVKVDKAFGEITSFVKGKWKETEPEHLKEYNFGKIVKLMVDEHSGVRAASQELAKLGCKPNREVAPGDWKSDDWEMKSDIGTPLRGDATTGSYLVPTLYASEVMRVALSNSAMMPLVRNVPMANRAIQWPAESTMLSLRWPSTEATAKSQATYTFTYVTLTAYTCAGFVPITEELNEDSMVPLGAYFRDIFGEAWGLEFDTQALVANAAPCTGVMRAASINTVTMALGRTSFVGVIPDDLNLLIAALTTQSKRQGARFIMHPTVLDYLCNVKNDMGDYIVRRATEGRPGSLLGYPFTECDAMPAIADTAAATPFIVFGNPSRILHGDRVGFEFRIFDQTEAAMQYDRIFLRCRLRQGFLTAVPGAFSVLKTASS
jgi:HK97 family phage major capsid protein